MTTITVYGAPCQTCKSYKTELFHGKKGDALVFLGKIPRGESVEVVQRTDGGEFIRSQSCMNKPSLWADIDQKWEDL